MFKDGRGNTSSMRVSMFVCICVACLIALLAIILDRDLSEAGVLVASIIAPTMVGKSVQTFGEKHE